MYASINAAAVDVYLASALGDPAIAVGDAEPCLRTDNAISSRPSPLAVPPFPEASIAQRADLTTMLALYVETMTAATRGATAEADGSGEDLTQAIGRTREDAARHEPHDLAIGSLVSALSAAVASVPARTSADAARRAVIVADPAVRQLIDVLGNDASSAHADAVGAARAAYAAWAAAYDRARRLALRRAPAASQTAAALPRCSSPAGRAPSSAATVAADATSAPLDAGAEIATFAMRAAVLARLETANRRYRTLLNADPAAMLASLARLDAALLAASRAPAEGGAAPELERALATFRAEAAAFADASAALVRSP